MTKYLTIGFTDTEEVGLTITPELNFMEAMQLYTTLGLHILNSYTKAAFTQLEDNPNLKTTKDKANAEIGIKESMYDVFNQGASNVLSMFYPDKEMRPDLTFEAIQKMENQIIEEKFKNLPPKERDQRLAAIRKSRLQAQARNRFSKADKADKADKSNESE